MTPEFFAALRGAFGSLRQNQVDGIARLLSATEGLPLRHRAYVLATAWHETGPEASALHMMPRREIWGPTDAQKRYEGRADLGNTIPGDGKRFAGRGYVQITGRLNYAKASRIVGVDLLAQPDLALDPEIAAKIIVAGMRDGWFTGRKMGDCMSYSDMRRVVNGSDKADLIAGYARSFEAALSALQPSPVVPVPSPPAPTPPVIPPTSQTPPAPSPTPASSAASLAGWVMAAAAGLVAIFAAWMMKG